MKQLIQKYLTGEIEIVDVTMSSCSSNYIWLVNIYLYLVWDRASFKRFR